MLLCDNYVHSQLNHLDSATYNIHIFIYIYINARGYLSLSHTTGKRLEPVQDTICSEAEEGHGTDLEKCCVRETSGVFMNTILCPPAIFATFP